MTLPLNVLRYERCVACGKDAVAVYTDGKTFCWACSDRTRPPREAAKA